ncbi:hypothetical protein ACFE04_020433 [Oxalis oulophora]
MDHLRLYHPIWMHSRIPNLKIRTTLLGSAFLYDIVWVYVSKCLIRNSVMVMVTRGGKSGDFPIPMLLTFPHYILSLCHISSTALDGRAQSTSIGLHCSFHAW